MNKPVKIKDFNLRKQWVARKDLAQGKAKAKKQDKDYKGLADKFNLKLGPSLDAWPKLFPDVKKMEADGTKIVGIVEKYRKFVKEAKLDKVVKKELNEGLDLVENELNAALIAATEAFTADQLNEDTGELNPGFSPFYVIRNPDFGKKIMSMAPDKLSAALPIEELEIAVLMTDDAVIAQEKKINSGIQAKMVAAANYTQLEKDLLAGYVEAAKIALKDSSKIDAANATFKKKVTEATSAALERATAEITRQLKVKSDYKKYKWTMRAKIVLAGAGAIAGTVSAVAVAPIPNPAVIISAIGAVKGFVQLGVDLKKLNDSAETMIVNTNKKLYALHDRYEKAKGSQVAAAELAVTTVNTFFPAFFKTIQSVEGDCDQIDSKIKGLDDKANDLAGKVDTALADQDKAMKIIELWEGQNEKGFDQRLTDYTKRLKSTLTQMRKNTHALLESTASMNARVAKARDQHETMASAVAILSAKEPTAAKWAEVFIGLTGSCVWLAAANAPGWPDAVNVPAAVKDVADKIGNAAGGTELAAESLKLVHDEVKKRMK